MTRIPTPAAIYAAELRVAEAKRNTRAGLGRTKTVFRAALVRPATLLGVFGASALVGFGLARRPRRATTAPSSGTATVAATTSVAGVILAFIVRYVMQRLPFILQRVWALRQQKAAQTRRDMSLQASPSGYPATGIRR